MGVCGGRADGVGSVVSAVGVFLDAVFPGAEPAAGVAGHQWCDWVHHGGDVHSADNALNRPGGGNNNRPQIGGKWVADLRPFGFAALAGVIRRVSRR